MMYDTLVKAAATAPSTSGLRQGDSFTSYAQVAERAGRVATGLIDRGVERAMPVGILMTNGPELLTLAYAVFAAGGVVVPLNPHAPRAELAATARKAHVAAVIASLPFSEVADTLIADLAGPGALPKFVAGGTDSFSIGVLERLSQGALPKLGEDDPALYMFSSGSTGIPKVVPHTHGELTIDSQGSIEIMGYSPDDVLINMLPGSHAMGFMLSATQLAWSGATTLYWSDPQPLMLSKARFASAIEQGGVTVVFGVPFMFDALASVTNEVDFGRVRLSTSGGVALKKDIYDRFRQRFGLKIRQAYGSTECLLMSFNDDPDPDLSWDSVGRAVPGLTIEIVPSENPFGPEYGEIAVRSAGVTKGYLDAAAVNAKTIQNGRFHTGDLGTIGADGNVYIKGRSKLIIEVAGHKVDPFEIEEVLLSHPSVAEAVVVGVPDLRTGEQRLKAVVVRTADESADTLIRYCRERLLSQKVPAFVEFRDEIPKSPTGKILRGKLMEPA
jgi:acyl-CoA synthetase (AMP-forming)/AMP-acid ligase II